MLFVLFHLLAMEIVQGEKGNPGPAGEAGPPGPPAVSKTIVIFIRFYNWEYNSACITVLYGRTFKLHTHTHR